jgi:hypothetical protein
MGARGAVFDVSGLGADHWDFGGWGSDAATSWDLGVVYDQANSVILDVDIFAQA